MLEIALEKFPVRTELVDGTPCSIRPMEVGDEFAFRNFHAVIPDREQLFILNQIKDGSLFEEWMADPESGEHNAFLAFVDARLVAMGYLRQRMGGWKRHIGEVCFLTHPDYRGMGLIDRKRRVNNPTDQAAADAADSDSEPKLAANFAGVRAAACSRVGFAGRCLIASAK